LSGLLSTQDYRVVGRPEPSPDEIPQAHYRVVTPRYFRVMGIPISGREFDGTDRERTRRVAVISRAFAERHWPDMSPLGEHIIVGADSLEIVGICDDVKQFGLDGPATADLYVPLRQMPASQAQFVAGRMYWVVATRDDALKVADPVRAAVHRLDKDVATSSIRPMPLVLAASVGTRRFNTNLIGIAGAASLLLALIGVYSVTSFSMTRRTREIGIRLTLGARPRQILATVLAAEWKPIALGLAAGALGGVMTGPVLGSVLFATSGVEPLVIGAAAVVLGVGALIASYLPARRALRTDPVAALRAQ
jgi:putative ABC transport system permease protein